MKGLLILIFIWITATISIMAQPFDTLLQQYNSIHEIYPLQDSTFILIGTGQSIRVERIDHQARVIWSVPVVSANRDYLADYRYDINSSDSLIQIATVDKYCDASYRSFYKIFTLNLSGDLIDSQTVSFGNEDGFIFLLSGLPSRPRLAFIEKKDVVVMQANGDTMHLHLTWENGDTNASYLIGNPKVVTMCPGGDILVGTNSLYVFYFRLENNRYVVVDQSYGGINNNLLCLDDQYFVTVHDHSLELWKDHYPLTSIDFTDGHIWRTTWRNPYLAVSAYNFNGPDSMYFLDSQLDLLHTEAFDIYNVANISIQQGITYKVGYGNTYFDQGLLLSENQITHEGPKFYNVELADFEVGPYDSVHWEYGWGSFYLYNVPHATVTLINHCDYTVNNLIIYYGRSNSICSDTSWERELLNMNLQPGETKTYAIQDIFITKSYPVYPSEKSCIYAIRPNKHFDDQFEDNEVCKKLDLIPSSNVKKDFPIHHYPTVFQDEIRFVAPEAIEFDLMIYSPNGIPVFASQANTYSGYTVDLRFLPAGLYFFQYYIPVSGQRYVEKILKY